MRDRRKEIDRHAAHVELDEFDLLDAKIDAFDFVSLAHKARLEEDIAVETARLRAKAVFKASKDASNPMKIDL